MNKLVEIFCGVDDFCRVFIPELEKHLLLMVVKTSRVSMSEITTIIIAFHMSNHRDFKNYYIGFISKFYKDHFPHLLSYTRLLEVMPRAIIPLSSYFSTLKGESTGIEFIDSTSIKVCHNLRISRHSTFGGIAQRGKGTTGWLYGFKLHLVKIIKVKLSMKN